MEKTILIWKSFVWSFCHLINEIYFKLRSTSLVPLPLCACVKPETGFQSIYNECRVGLCVQGFGS
jgi:hypothetical protein